MQLRRWGLGSGQLDSSLLLLLRFFERTTAQQSLWAVYTPCKPSVKCRKRRCSVPATHVCRVSQASSVESDAAQCPPHVCHCFCAPFIKKGNYLGPKHTVNLTRNLYWEKSLVYLSCKIATSSNLYYI
jgi:hypothetical protein